MPTFQSSSWTDVTELRNRLMSRSSATVREAAQAFAEDLAGTYSSVVLARLFLVVPVGDLPAADRAFASALVKGDARFGPTTRVLSLLGTCGREKAWHDRASSSGHLAVPLLSRAHVETIPMIARLLGDLSVDFAGLDTGSPIASTRMLGGENAKFYVPDAETAKNARGEFVIPARDFVAAHGVRTVFGMGGAYLDGTLAVTLIFTDEQIDRLVVDRFPSLISNFKMATAPLLAKRRLYA